MSSGGAPTPAGTSVFFKHNWDMEWGICGLMGGNIHPLMCEALMSLPTSERTSGEVTILLVTSPEISN